jgi:hypothetical protein
MEQYIDILKQLGGILAVAVSALKLWLSGRTPRPKELEERADRLQKFFHDGGLEQHPILVEARFGAALGHLNLSAKEIPLLLRQTTPTQFLQQYLHVKQYIEPAADGSAFVLKSVAASRFLSIFTRVALALLYVLYAGAAVWMALQELPSLITAAAWLKALEAVAFTCFTAVGAWYFLIEARRISWAIQLQREQNVPEPCNAPDLREKPRRPVILNVRLFVKAP